MRNSYQTKKTSSKGIKVIRKSIGHGQKFKRGSKPNLSNYVRKSFFNRSFDVKPKN